ncbi:MAG: urease accessory UreF family protein [Sulfitobacter sp.]|nr:urease accessory UreF family protein [Sulfitobacter sp.]
MATAAPIPMPTDAAFLTLAQWFSPAYPVGAFAYSHGLEGAVAAGEVGDADSLEEWVLAVLQTGAGRNDALLLAAAYRAPDGEALAEVNATARALAASAGRLRETTDQGASFCEITARAFGLPLRDLAYPVAAGAAARAAGLSLDLTQQFYLQAFAGNLVTAAQRLCPIGQSAAQTLIRGLSAPILDIVAETGNGDLDQLRSAAFLSDIAAMQQETLHARIFRT